MKISTEMSLVNECSMSECAYNTEQKCHAKAITVGDGNKPAMPACDTLFCNAPRVQGTDIHAGVGACKVNDCEFNSDMECTAEGVTIGLKGNEVQCLTFTMS